MKKVTIYIQAEQWDQLGILQRETGISKSELIRRFVETGIRYATIPNLDSIHRSPSDNTDSWDLIHGPSDNADSWEFSLERKGIRKSN